METRLHRRKIDIPCCHRTQGLQTLGVSNLVNSYCRNKHKISYLKIFIGWSHKRLNVGLACEHRHNNIGKKLCLIRPLNSNFLLSLQYIWFKIEYLLPSAHKACASGTFWHVDVLGVFVLNLYAWMVHIIWLD